MGLVSDGHGNWYDRQGQYKGRTYKGDLLLSKGKDLVRKTLNLSKNVPLNQRMENKKQHPHPNQEVVLLVEKNLKIQRKERERLLLLHLEGSTLLPLDMRNCWTPQSVKLKGGDYKIYPSRSEDPKKNPLSPDEKISYMRKMYPTHDERIVNDEDMRSIFDVLKKANEDGYSNVNIMVGADRQSEFEKLATKYNGELYDFGEINVISAGERDPDAEGVEGMSASKLEKQLSMETSRRLRRGFRRH